MTGDLAVYSDETEWHPKISHFTSVRTIAVLVRTPTWASTCVERKRLYEWVDNRFQMRLFHFLSLKTWIAVLKGRDKE